MVEVKRGRGRPKKVQQEQIKQETITQEDIEKALAEMLDSKMAEYGVTKNDEPQQSVDATDMVAMMNVMLFDNNESMSTTPTVEWQAIFNIATRIYETNEDSYKNVKYDPRKDAIVISLDKTTYPSLSMELTRIKNAVCASSLNYSGIENDSNLVITISKK